MIVDCIRTSPSGNLEGRGRCIFQYIPPLGSVRIQSTIINLQSSIPNSQSLILSPPCLQKLSSRHFCRECHQNLNISTLRENIKNNIKSALEYSRNLCQPGTVQQRMKRRQMERNRAPDSRLDTSIRFYNAFAETCRRARYKILDSGFDTAPHPFNCQVINCIRPTH